MSVHPLTTYLRGLWPPRPWPVLITGTAITLVGLALSELGDGWAGLRFAIFLAGLTTAGLAVSLQFKKAGQAFEERMETAGVLAVAAFAALIALLDYLGPDHDWDTIQLLLVVMVGVTLLGVVLVLLPTPARMIVVGVLIVIHFGGMMTAATTIDPPGASAPWVSQELWVRFYHPYLQFMYLNNAYHFYSPEPGPPSVVWFHIRYNDGKVKWFKIPHRDDDPSPIHHTRLLSITESTSVYYPQPPEDFATWSDIQYERRQAGEKFEIPIEESNHIQLPQSMQYQEPQPYSQKMMESYVRHVADTFPSLGEPDNTVQSIKVYRFRQNIIPPQAMAERRDPKDKAFFVGYYQGEYDKDGNLLHTQDKFDASGKKLIDWKDRFRYWYMPIYYRPPGAPDRPITPDMKPADLELVDCLTRHARLDLSGGAPVYRDDPDDDPWADGGKP